MPDDTASTPPAVPFGQALGEAHRGASGLHLRILDRHATTFLQWVVINTIATAGEPVVATDLTAHLSKELSIDAAEIEEVLTGLRERGWVDIVAVDGAGVLTLTNDGDAHYQRLRAAIGRLTAQLLASFDQTEIATAVKVLTAIRERAPLVAADL
jgi:DNA-binding MarR family transcriptional regulator